jgi:hypothetical protein
MENSQWYSRLERYAKEARAPEKTEAASTGEAQDERQTLTTLNSYLEGFFELLDQATANRLGGAFTTRLTLSDKISFLEESDVLRKLDITIWHTSLTVREHARHRSGSTRPGRQQIRAALEAMTSLQASIIERTSIESGWHTPTTDGQPSSDASVP